MSSPPQEPWLFSAIRNFQRGHERLKTRVHTAWRYPLPKWGQVIMAGVYFTIPIVGGYHVMQWAIRKSHENIGEHGELLNVKKIQGIGDKRIEPNGTLEQVGAGGLGGGVKLAVSDEKTQEQNKAMLEAFFREQRKRERRKKKMEASNTNETEES
jgi:hypothetical protein